MIKSFSESERHGLISDFVNTDFKHLDVDVAVNKFVKILDFAAKNWKKLLNLVKKKKKEKRMMSLMPTIVWYWLPRSEKGTWTYLKSKAQRTLQRNNQT